MSGVVFVVFAGVFFASPAPFSIPSVQDACGQAPLDLRWFSTGDEVMSFLDGCGASGRAAYVSMQTADLFYPLVFGLFLASSLAMVLGRLFPRRPAAVALAGVALLGAGFDYLENVLAWGALSAFPRRAATNDLLGIASAAKNLTFWFAATILVVGLTGLAVQRVRRGGGRISEAATDGGGDGPGSRAATSQ